MMAADGLPPLRDVVQTHGIAAKKSLGQNFLFDLNLTGRIARAAGPLEDVTVIEVGPGPGGLTRALLANGAKHVVAIERDERCSAALADIAARYPGRLSLVNGDALEIDYYALAADHGGGGPVRIVANLPYNIGTVLLARWLEGQPEGQQQQGHIWPPFWDRMILMFQKEVAERIVATPQQRADYGRLGVLCGWLSEASILFDVPREAFTPPPKITSAVVELVPRPVLEACDLATLSAITRAAFGQRRKMLRQSLKSLHIRGHQMDAGMLLAHAGLNPQARAEEIGVHGYVQLSNSALALRAGID
ncbi:MAG: 16S rRNA (adenine(1518)-N(6)/adenine(1519)-N(6))-dimethyltransferase RsmA [Beijerinckiaceae bacterium]|jgi:16S rRNA (adenine1518-N6/adenine1519-N6)-dimethyltransferase|nr:16S rRNA (adenine(1518)-N(6)/adenine(1519)-N(6))-dimethyltransferase RsmA [Beijerinckiaceae bacterium]